MKAILHLLLLYGCATAPGDDGPTPDCDEPWERAAGSACIDVDECATDNGGCGDSVAFSCLDQQGAPPLCRFDPAHDYAFLTDGVDQIDSGGSQPDSFVVWGETAFPVVLDEEHRAFVVAARAGAGRVVAFGHEGYLRADEGTPGDMEVLVYNAVRWAGREGEGLHVGVAPGLESLRDRLNTLGHVAETRGPSALAGLDVYVLESWNDLGPEGNAQVSEAMLSGLGIVLGGHAWYWAYSNADPWANYSGNQAVRGSGIAWTSWGDTSAGLDAVPSEPPSPLWYTAGAMAAIDAHLRGGGSLDLTDQRAAAAAVARTVRVLPLDAGDFFAAIDELSQAIGPVTITADAPLDRATTPLQELVATVDLKYAESLPPDRLAEHPIAADFPTPEGLSLSPGPAVTRTILASYEGLPGQLWYAGAGEPVWRSLGLYAPPALPVTLEFPAEAIDTGLSVLVGSHTDDDGGHETWLRYPRVTRSYAVTGTQVVVGNTFGGLLYVRVPAGVNLGAIDITITGAAAAPRFVLGETTPSLWATTERAAPAPWAEIEGSAFIATVPSDAVRDLDDPTGIAEFWDAVILAEDTLAGWQGRPRAERMVFDRDISAGWMHSGYPVMAFLASVPEIVDIATTQAEGAWGPFHEFGHNHQWGPWILPGTTEGTCNLFSVYVSEELLGIDRGTAHPALRPEARQETIDDYLATGPDFWGSWNVWTALETHLQVQEAFGWEPFTTVFADYRSLSPGDEPQGDEARINEFWRRIAEATGHDLGPFLLAWGMPLSQETLDALALLPDWTDAPLP